MKNTFFLSFLVALLIGQGVPALADVTVTEQNAAIASGNASYSASFYNDTENAADPAVIIANYENNVLTGISIAKGETTISAGASGTIRTQIPAAVSDTTRIVGFTVDSLEHTVPLSIRKIENFGSDKMEILSVSLPDVPEKDIVLDEANKKIVIRLPFFDANGDAYPIEALKTTLTLSHPKASVRVENTGILFEGETEAKEAVVNFKNAPNLIVTSEDGRSCVYHTVIYRKLYTGFEEGLLTGGKVENGKFVANAGDIAPGKKAGEYLYLQTAAVSSGVDRLQYDPYLYAGLKNIEGADHTLTNALYIAKTRQGSSNAVDTNALRLYVGSLRDISAMPKELTISYDIKYEQVDGDAFVNPAVSGLDIHDKGLYYRVTTDGAVPFSNSKTVVNGKVVADTNIEQWNHIKLVFCVENGNIVCSKAYVNGEYIASADNTNAGAALSVSDKPFFSIGLSSRRCCGIYLDNVQFEYLLSESSTDSLSQAEEELQLAEKADALNFTPTVGENGKVTVEGFGTAGLAFAAVAKVDSEDEEVIFTQENWKDFIALDAAETEENGHFQFEWQLPDLNANGYYAFVVGNTGAYTKQSARKKILYYASPDEVRMALERINAATEETLAAVLEDTVLTLQTQSFLGHPTYIKFKSDILKTILAERKTGFASMSELHAAMQAAIGICAVANSTETDLDLNFAQYAQALNLNLDGYNRNKEAVQRCFATVSKEFTQGHILSLDTMGELLQTAFCLADMNTASRGKIMEIAEQNEVLLGIKVSNLSQTDKNAVAKQIYVIDKEYTTILDFKNAFDNALRKLVSDENNSSGKGGSASGGSLKPITSAGTTKTEIELSQSLINVQEAPKYPVFDDLEDAAWAKKYIEALAKSGVVSGRSQTKYEPEAFVTREEFVKMLVAALKLESTKQVEFTDVARDAWYTSYIGAAIQGGIVTGYEDGRFGIGENIKRQDVAVMISRALKQDSGEAFSNTNSFGDKNSIADYARDAVAVCSALGIIDGNENNEFMPQKDLTRAECAKIIYCVINVQ